MKLSLWGKFLISFIILFLIFSFLYFLFKEKKEFQVDVLIFAPHPDDEVLCCGGTIFKRVKEGRKVKVVFLTNGDTSSQSILAWTGKQPYQLQPRDYIILGKKRQEEAIKVGDILGIKKENIIFLSYPDGGLSYLLNNFYNNFYLSKKTNTTSSPYQLTYNRARKGYTKENLILDIKEILEKHRPREIYLPHVLDAHKDHQSTSAFVFLALNELKASNEDWLDSLKIFSYLIHDPARSNEGFHLSNPFLSYVFSREPDWREDISDLKEQKSLALKEYRSQVSIKEIEEFLNSFVKDFELFWTIPSTPKAYLRDLEKEWEKIGEIMRKSGYNVNFAPVVDVAENIEDFNMPLTGKKRIFSEDPEIVAELAGAIVKGMQKGGVIPVIKHFPGSGRSLFDTHVWLPEIKISKKELYQRELIPFIRLLEKNYDFWIMVDHSIYPLLEEKPASLSYEIQTKLLREELRFKGIIIVDELLNMQAIREYTFREDIKAPYIGEIVAQAFAAGADIALFYVSSPQEAEMVIEEIISRVKKAINENKISQEKIDESVARILAQKEKVFGIPLLHLINNLTIEEKILQKLMTDIYVLNDDKKVKKWMELLKKYNIGGIFFRNANVIDKFQKQAKIPIFAVAQHEGGMVNHSDLNIKTKSAYAVGREYELLKKRAGEKISYNVQKKVKNRYGEISSPTIGQIDEATHNSIIDSLIESVDELISSFRKLDERGYTSPNPNYLSPLTINFTFSCRGCEEIETETYEIKSFLDVPIDWLRKFSNQEVALQAYLLFKEIFHEWKEEHKELNNQKKSVPDIIQDLSLLKEKIESKRNVIYDPGAVKKLRILVLATHPDDEDSEALAYFKYKFNSETYILLATKGEGGESLIDTTPHRNLGELRMEEMEKAGEILKVNRIYYMNLEDFGYCNNEKEAMEKWNREKVIEKIIYFYNLIKPHIIITKNTIFDEHCQHRTFISLALEAFDKSFNYGWQPLKFYQRDFENKSKIFIDITEKDPASGRTLKEIALDSLSQHQSQKLGKWAQMYRSSWADKIYYRLIKTKISGEGNFFFSGINKEHL
jgi:LmbE family N-acetylglucosaminyl deacetylase